MRETGKPIARVARELGINEGTLGNWVATERRARERGNGVLSQDERAELVRLRREVAELATERVCSSARSPSGEGSDGAVSLAAFIVSQRDEHAVPGRRGLPGVGGLAGLVLQVAPR